ncbi:MULTISPECIES: hypothetical protein [Shewanella]|nr:hypothetical protein [Shewanella psychromarinicola]MCL1084285.1 hypothetical protein [Shewanella psychromarinicola]
MHHKLRLNSVYTLHPYAAALPLQIAVCSQASEDKSTQTTYVTEHH